MASLEEMQRLRIDVHPALKIRGPPKAYKNQSHPRGALFISNCRHFDDSVKHQERLGSDRDFDNIKHLFSEIGYKCICAVEDLTREELLKELDSFKEHEIHQHVDSLVAVFMSHGDDGKLVTRVGEYVQVEEICNKFDDFSCPMLQDKPKVFFFQHCRGAMEIAIPDLNFATDGRIVTPEPRNYPKPGISHAFLCFSTRKGFVSYRDKRRGAVFIENVCKVFMERAKDKRLVDLIGEVNSKLSGSHYQQSCDVQLINYHYPFYFNPTPPKMWKKREESFSLFEREVAQCQRSHSSDEWGEVEDFWYRHAIKNLSCLTERKTSSQQHNVLTPAAAPPSPTSQHSANDAIKKNKMINYVFILSYLLGCNEDIRNIELKFTQMDFKVIKVPPVLTLEALKENIRSNGIRRDSTVIVFFFGEGYKTYLYLGKDSAESVSFRAFTDAFRGKRRRACATVIFTNTCFTYRSSTTVLATAHGPLWNAFHVCVNVYGDCSKGSVLARALLQEFELNESKEEFADFACSVKRRVEDLSANDDDQYIVDIRYYGVYTPYHFPCHSGHHKQPECHHQEL